MGSLASVVDIVFFPLTLRCWCQHHLIARVAKVLGFWGFQEPSQCLWENRSLMNLNCTGRMPPSPFTTIWYVLRNWRITFKRPTNNPFRFYNAPVWTPLVASHACGRVDTLHAIVTMALLSQVQLKWSKRGSFPRTPMKHSMCATVHLDVLLVSRKVEPLH